jgi:biotin-dependent carboxylase-like uncharacterized protein
VSRALRVEAPGPLTTVQDLGRPGLARLGVSPSGAVDRRSFRLANRLVGNPEDAAALEVTLGGVRVRAVGALAVAVTGMAVDVTVDGAPVAMNGPVELADGQLLELGSGRRGLRSYIAVRGGLRVEPVLGSRATDVLSGLGPDVVTADQTLPVGPPPDSVPVVEVAPVAEVGSAEARLRVVPGPRDDWFQPDALATLFESEYRVTQDSNRVAMKLSGPRLRRCSDRELPSEGIVRGSLQVPPSGQPVLFLADHPVTGGYPVIGVVVDEDTDMAAQLRPGATLRFGTVAREPR